MPVVSNPRPQRWNPHHAGLAEFPLRFTDPFPNQPDLQVVGSAQRQRIGQVDREALLVFFHKLRAVGQLFRLFYHLDRFDRLAGFSGLIE